MPEINTKTANKLFESFSDKINDLDEVDKGIMQRVLATFWDSATEHKNLKREKALLIFNKSIETVEADDDLEWEESDHVIFQEVRDYLNAASGIGEAVERIEKFADDLADELE